MNCACKNLPVDCIKENLFYVLESFCLLSVSFFECGFNENGQRDVGSFCVA